VANDRVSQEPVEVVYRPIPGGRTSQEPVEVVVKPVSGAVVEQLPVEVIAANVAPPPQLSYWKAGVLTVPGSTGPQAITGLGANPGQRPKAVVFFGANWTAEDSVVTTPGTALFRGMACEQWDSPGTIVQDAAAVGPGDQHREAAAAILNLTSAGSAAVLYQASLTSLDVDGFTLDWTTVAGGGYKIVYAALFDVEHAAGYRGEVSAMLSAVGFKAGAALVQGSWAGPDISGGDRSQEWYGGAAYPTGASSNWQGAGMSVQCFPTSQSQQNQVYLDSLDPTILTVSAQHFTGPFLIGSNIKAHPSGVHNGDFSFYGDDTNGGMAMFWDDDDAAAGYATPDAVAGNVVSEPLPFDPGLVLGYSVSDEPRAQGTGGRGAAGFSVVGFDADGNPFQWGALVDRINPGAIQSFAKVPNIVHDTSLQSMSVELVSHGFEMTTVDADVSPVSWLYQAFGHPLPLLAGAWIPGIYRRIVNT
jgi:hypothetical protein